MTDQDLKSLSAAVQVLEHPGLAARLASMVGKPIDLLRQALPAGAAKAIAVATTKALDAAFAVAIRSIRNDPRAGSRLIHKVMATASGAVGGSFGLAALPVELPISTVIMLRSIADIARSEGEDLADPQTALACIEVFALGGRSSTDDDADSGYFAVRGVLAKSISEATRFIAERGIVAEGAPLLAAFIAQVASRFGVVVTQKLAAQILPVVGALGGAAVNYAFIDHFQAVARAHFTVRRFERAYGKDVVHVAYQRLRDDMIPKQSVA